MSVKFLYFNALYFEYVLNCVLLVKMKSKVFIFLCSFLLSCTLGKAQDTIPYVPPPYGPNDTLLVGALIESNTLVPFQWLEWHVVTAKLSKQQAKRMSERNRLKNAVLVTYPYAKEAAKILLEMQAHLATISSDKDKKAYIKSREAELKKKFTDPLTNLSVYQGKVLMKLINRETGNNCYEIIKEYKGGVSARFWQTIAFVFNSNLKQPYRPDGDDREIEIYVREAEIMYFGRF